MAIDPEIMHLATTEAQKLENDPNRPYRVRRRREGVKNSRGSVSHGTGEQYEYRTISNMRTDPLDDNDFNRLPEGLRTTSWRFVMVLPDKIGDLPINKSQEFLDFGEQFEYNNHWFEVEFINDWDLIQSCKARLVE